MASLLEEAENRFHDTVKMELERLVHDSGMKSSVAVQMILSRISDKSASREEAIHLVDTLNITEEDAIRAIIVRDEIRSMRQQGMDTLTAVRVLSKRVLVDRENSRPVKRKNESPVTLVIKKLKESVKQQQHAVHCATKQEPSPVRRSKRKLPVGDKAINKRKR